MNNLKFYRTRLHLNGSSLLCGLVLMLINLPARWIERVGGKDDELLKGLPRSLDLTSSRLLSLGLREKTGLCPSSSHKLKGTQAEYCWCAGKCYRRHAASCLAGTRRATWFVQGHRMCAEWKRLKRLQNPHMLEFLEFHNLDLCKKLFCWTFNLFNFIHLEFVVSQINTSLYIAISFKYLPSSVLCKIVIPWVLHGLVFWGKFIKFCWRWKLLFENVQHHFMQIDSFGVYLNKS